MALTETTETERRELQTLVNKNEAQRSGFVFERKTEGAERSFRGSYATTETERRELRLTTWGCTGFDGGVEAGIAGGCAYHP